MNDKNELVYIGTDRIYPHPDNPRKDLGDLAELIESIRANGVLQNLTVIRGRVCSPGRYHKLAEQGRDNLTEELRDEINTYANGTDTYTVIIGHRRLAAAKAAGLEKVPCIIAEMDAKEQLSTMLLENIQRSDLNIFEQAQGFQMMMQLGSTVAEISEKTGLSETTVRKRVRLAELDQETLKSVSEERQITMADLDKLNQLEKLEDRNNALKEIGTYEFDLRIKGLKREELAEKALGIVMPVIGQAGLKTLPEKEKYSSKWEQLKPLYLDEKITEKVKLPNGCTHYLHETYSHCIRFYRRAKRAEAVRRSPEEIEKQHRLQAAWAKADELTGIINGLHDEFIDRLEITKKNRDSILRGLCMAMVMAKTNYCGSIKLIYETLFGRDPENTAENNRSTANVMRKLSEKLYAEDRNVTLKKLIYAMLGYRGENEHYSFFNSYRSDFPTRTGLEGMDILCQWLRELGYEESTEERQLQEGTHEIFRAREKQNAGDKEEENNDGEDDDGEDAGTDD